MNVCCLLPVAVTTTSSPTAVSLLSATVAVTFPPVADNSALLMTPSRLPSVSMLILMPNLLGSLLSSWKVLRSMVNGVPLTVLLPAALLTLMVGVYSPSLSGSKLTLYAPSIVLAVVL